MHRVADHDAHDAKAAAETGQRAQVVAAIVLPLQRQDRLRRQAQFVRDRYADAAVADVEAEITNSFQLFAPASSLSSGLSGFQKARKRGQTGAKKGHFRAKKGQNTGFAVTDSSTW
jgi:hypothetical protein